MSASEQALPPALATAQKWATDLGNQVTQVTAQRPGGPPEPALQIKHGAYVLFAKLGTEAGVLVIMAIADLPPEFRARLARLDEESKIKLYVALKFALVQNSRDAFEIHPVTSKNIAEVERFGITQMLRVEEGDTASFNRLADAIQELVTGLARASMALGPVQGDSGTNVNSVRSDGSTNPMYR